MTVYMGDVSKRVIRHVGKEQRVCTFQIVCNGSGGVTSVTADDPACTAADGGANGDLDITFPASPKGQIFVSIAKSAAATICYAYFSALDMTAGTASVITGKNITNTDPASGDILHIEVWGTVAP